MIKDDGIDGGVRPALFFCKNSSIICASLSSCGGVETMVRLATQDNGSKQRKLSVEDFLYLMRKNFQKLNRCTE
ncbi:hypothetical protein G4B88_015241 [Cannabis sativa]|uniref:Uncharacterized protein n=1 Tax=Cannabis sativa TaxID=3483 RepID=A0A7J6HD80_CANSA|nr:hypothetical protein G4B88_015241 [Cannabis sativa]